MKKLFGLLLIILVINQITTFSVNQQNSDKLDSSKTKLVWPLPSSISINQTAPSTQIDPCSISLSIQAVPNDGIKQMVQFYQKNVFKCSKISNSSSTQLLITVTNPNKFISQKVQDQQYQLNIKSLQKWQIISFTHVGFLRGLQTLSQLIQNFNDKFIINGIPIYIDDMPNYHYRGIMLDSSRHFLSVESIKKQIDALMYNKMTVLHWHITDQDSFPIQISSRPQLSKYGKFSGTYSKNDVKQIINYGKLRGVRIIPQFDTPGHTQSWGRSPQLKDIIVKCNTQYQGQFDPTLNLTYQVVNDVMKQYNEVFSDNYVHFGGDQISTGCWNNKPSIKQWMQQNNIQTYKDLEIYYRQRQKQLWRKISPNKKAMYWTNKQLNLPLQDDDVIHWWGYTSDLSLLSGRKNQIVLSNYDLAYLDLGFGGRRGVGYGTFITWRDLYKYDPAAIKDVNVIGGQACLWAQTSNQQVQDQKLWPRTSVLNQRLWNTNIDGKKDILNIATRLIAQTNRMKQRGFKASPVTVGLCQKDPSICWNQSQ